MIQCWRSSRISLGLKTSQAVRGTIDIRLVVGRAPFVLKVRYFHSIAWIYLGLLYHSLCSREAQGFCRNKIFSPFSGERAKGYPPLLHRALSQQAWRETTCSNAWGHKGRLRNSGVYRHLRECLTTISSKSCRTLFARPVIFLGTPGCILNCSIHRYPLMKFHWIQNFPFQEEITEVLLLLKHRTEQVPQGNFVFSHTLSPSSPNLGGLFPLKYLTMTPNMCIFLLTLPLILRLRPLPERKRKSRNHQ